MPTLTKTEKLFFLAVGAATAVAVGALASSGPDPLEREQAMYCEMVELHKQDPSVGWPDYNHNYNEVCANAR